MQVKQVKLAHLRVDFRVFPLVLTISSGLTLVLIVLLLLLTTLMVGKMTTLIKRFLNLLDRIPTFGVFVARQGR